MAKAQKRSAEGEGTRSRGGARLWVSSINILPYLELGVGRHKTARATLHTSGEKATNGGPLPYLPSNIFLAPQGKISRRSKENDFYHRNWGKGAACANFSRVYFKAAWESTGGAAGELKFEDCAPQNTAAYPTYPRRGIPQNTAAYPTYPPPTPGSSYPRLFIDETLLGGIG